MRTTIIGIGAQKCASSWLHAIAGSHPEIAVSTPKEVDFFSYFFDHGYRWYESHFPSTPNARAAFESSPSYFHDPRAPERARGYAEAHAPDLKVLALLRDPVARAFSSHLHEIIKGHISACSFEAGLKNNPSYVEQSLYATHLSRWFDAFPRERIKVMFAEEISADPGGAAADLFEFMGVDPSFESAILHERRNESDRARYPLLRRYLRGGGDWMRRRGLEPMLARVKAQPIVARALNANSISVRDEIPPMLPETCAALTERFAPEVYALGELLHRNVPWNAWHQEAAQ